MSHARVYPISDSYRKTLRTIDAFREAVKLNRILKKRFSASDTDVEIMILLASHAEPLSMKFIIEQMNHLTPKHVKRSIRSMLNDNFLTRFDDLDETGIAYSVSLMASTTIKNVFIV